MEILTNESKLEEQLLLIVKLFYNKNSIDNLKLRITHASSFNDNFLKSQIWVEVKKHKFFKERIDECDFSIKSKYHYIEKYAKILLYQTLSKITRKNAPWGALTGIRPSKLFNDLVKQYNNDINKVNAIFKNTYLVSDNRIKLLNMIYDQQNKKSENNSDNLLDFYVNIPFCISKCYYCSFLSAVIDKAKHLIQPYVDKLIYEIKKTLEFIKMKKFVIRNVYIGGGTPTAIPLEFLEKILKLFPNNISEFTVEAGRPDTITEDTFKVFKKYGVTRISINPQTFNNKTLKAIGRKHTAEDCVEKFKIAQKYGFIINMDLIAGLSGEKFKDFKFSLNKAISLNPNNITVHTLCYKRTSNLNLIGGSTSSDKETEKMVSYSIKKLLKNKYYPYYLYKQKNTLANLENIGYCRDNQICRFNINSMEETSSIIACGANGISKRLFTNENRIERFANVKNIEEYINRIDEMIDKKFNLFN